MERVRRQDKKLDLESDLYSCIYMIEDLSEHFENGILNPNTYKRQLKGLLKDLVKIRTRLSQQEFNMDEFLEREKIKEKFPRAAKKLLMLDGKTDEQLVIAEQGDQIVLMPYEKLRTLPMKATEFVTNNIELLDLLKLKTIATVEYILPYIDEMIAILESLDIIPDDYWIIKEMKKWQVVLSKKKPSEKLRDELLSELELQATRWFNDFKRILKGL